MNIDEIRDNIADNTYLLLISESSNNSNIYASFDISTRSRLSGIMNTRFFLGLILQYAKSPPFAK